jgi:hypothetical protein
VPQGWYLAEPAEGRWLRFRVDTESDVSTAVDAVLAMTTEIGHPTLSVQREDGSLLTLSTDGERGFLVHFDADGVSHSSVGGPYDEPSLVYDYEGHWSEAASKNTVPSATAVGVVNAFIRSDGAFKISALPSRLI